jgi:hypothetical protein
MILNDPLASLSKLLRETSTSADELVCAAGQPRRPETRGNPNSPASKHPVVSDAPHSFPEPQGLNLGKIQPIGSELRGELRTLDS